MIEIMPFDASGNTMDGLVQWDKDVYVYLQDEGLSQAYPVHFFNNRMEKSLSVDSVCEGGYLKAKIPNVLLRESLVVVGYVYTTEGDESKSAYGFKINVRRKPKPSDYVEPADIDFRSVEELLDECKRYAQSASGSATNAGEYARQSKESASQSESAAQRAAKEAERAQAFSGHAPTIIDGTWWIWDEKSGAYVDTGEDANGDVLMPTFDLDVMTGDLYMYANEAYSGPDFRMTPDGYLEVVVHV